MKCPYCNSEIKPETYIGWRGEKVKTGCLYCTNKKCICHYPPLTPGIFDSLSKGKKAQEALEIAIANLIDITASGFIHETLQETVSKALDKIDEIMKQDEKKSKEKDY